MASSTIPGEAGSELAARVRHLDLDTDLGNRLAQ
jgi:hypothetical protein